MRSLLQAHVSVAISFTARNSTRLRRPALALLRVRASSIKPDTALAT